MIYLARHEIIPETHRRENQDAATIGLMIGLVLMFFSRCEPLLALSD